MKHTSHVSINNFKNEIAHSDIYSKINKDIDSDPNINYDIIHNILKSATKQHLAPKIVKFKKRRHEKAQCITQGIVKSVFLEINYITAEEHQQIQMHAIELKLT